MFKSGPNYNKLKTNLRLIVNRLKLLEKKKTEMGLKARKEIADYIMAGKEDRARIRVEHIIREDYLVEAMEMLEMYCDLLLARFGLISTQKELDPGLEESISSIIWATPRLQADVPEFKAITEQFSVKYSKEFALACRTNELNNVNEKVMHKLGVQAPPKILVERYLVEIARTYNVSFDPDPSVMIQDEIFAAENILIDLGGDDLKKGGGGGGGGGGMGVMNPASNPQPPVPFSYPHSGPPAGQVPPPIPSSAPSGPSYMPPGPQNAAYPPPGSQYPPPADLYAPEKPPRTNENMRAVPMAPKNELSMPQLPDVPDLSVGSSSAGGEDVDFDDLNRRFEELKRKK